MPTANEPAGPASMSFEEMAALAKRMREQAIDDAALRALAEAATPGPWQVDITRHPYSMVRLDGSFAEGEHVERWIQTVRIDPQAKAPHPIVVRSVGIAHPGEPPIPMVHIRPEDADYLAAVSPEVVLALLDENAAIRARLAAAEQERDVALRLAVLGATESCRREVLCAVAYRLMAEHKTAEARAEKAEAEVARLREALAAIVARSETGELGTSRTRDMAHLARAALAETADTPAVQPDPTPDPDGWIKWGGGECPAPDGAWADVEFRNGIAYCTSNPSGLEWAHEGNEVDIVAYRIVEARDE